MRNFEELRVLPVRCDCRFYQSLLCLSRDPAVEIDRSPGSRSPEQNEDNAKQSIIWKAELSIERLMKSLQYDQYGLLYSRMSFSFQRALRRRLTAGHPKMRSLQHRILVEFLLTRKSTGKKAGNTRDKRKIQRHTGGSGESNFRFTTDTDRNVNFNTSPMWERTSP